MPRAVPPWCLSAALVGWGFVAGGGPAQGQFDDLHRGEVAVGLAGWAGAQAARFEPGFRGVLGLHAEVAFRRQIGLEVLYGRFGPDGPGSTVRETAVAFTGRRTLEPWKSSTPYLQARLGGHRLDGTGPRSAARQLGLQAGPEVGLLVPTARDRLAILAAFDVTWLWYADARDETGTVQDSGGYSFRWGLRLGVSVDPSR